MTPIYVAESNCTLVGDTITKSGVAANACMTFDQAQAASGIPLRVGDEKLISIYDNATPAYGLWRAIWNGTTWQRVITLQEFGVFDSPGAHLVAIVENLTDTRPVGYHLQYVSSTVIRATPGEIIINGVSYADVANVTAMEGDNVTTGTFSPAIDKLYHVFLYDDSGTRKLYLVRRDAAAEDPIYDVARRYWKAPSTDGDGNSITNPENYRCIGFFRTKLSNAEIISFSSDENNDTTIRTITFDEYDGAQRVLNNVDDSTKWTETELLPSPSGADIVPVNSISVLVKAIIGIPSTGMAGLGMSHADQGSTVALSAGPVAIQQYVEGASNARLGILDFPLTERLNFWWRTVGTNASIYVDIVGAKFQI